MSSTYTYRDLHRLSISAPPTDAKTRYEYYTNLCRTRLKILDAWSVAWAVGYLVFLWYTCFAASGNMRIGGIAWTTIFLIAFGITLLRRNRWMNLRERFKILKDGAEGRGDG